MTEILSQLRGSNMDITEFNKENFVSCLKSLTKEQRIKHEHLKEILGCSEKTLGYYLNPERTELPKIPAFTRLFQYLNTSPAHLLVQKGPRLIGASSADKIFEIMNRLTNVSCPAIRVTLHYLLEMSEDELRSLNKLIAGYKELTPLQRKKVLSSLLNLLPDA